MSQSQLEDSHRKFKAYLKFLFYTTQLNFLPDCRWRCIKYIEMAIMPSLLIFNTVLALTKFISLIGKSFDLAGFLYLIIMPCAWAQVIVKFFITAVFYKKEMDAFVRYFDCQVFNTNILTKIRQRIMPRTINLANKFGSACVVAVSGYHYFSLTTTKFTSVLFFSYVAETSFLHVPLNIILQSISMVYSIWLMTLVDILFLFMMVYFKGEFDSISLLFGELNEDRIIPDKDCERILLESFKFHMKANEMLMIFRRICWFNLLVQFSTSLVYICMVLYMTNSTSTTSVFFIIPPAVVGQTLLVCYTGEIIKSSSEGVPISLAATKWYQMSIENQRFYLMVLTFTQQPTVLSTFGMNEVSLSAFLKILKMTFSYCAFLYTIFN
uniref:Odorant receptor n=1 Tax=Lutzomyia longipalpis TaxID=7200 RepID=A0A3F2ZDG6_LUTLO